MIGDSVSPQYGSNTWGYWIPSIHYKSYIFWLSLWCKYEQIMIKESECEISNTLSRITQDFADILHCLGLCSPIDTRLDNCGIVTIKILKIKSIR